MLTRLHLCLPACLALLVLQSSAPVVARHAPSKVAQIENFANAFANVPCEDSERLAAVRGLFEQVGAPADAITLDRHDGVDNLVVVKPGKTAEKIVIGAHYDKVADGCGAVDNWTGLVAMTALYQTLRDIPLDKTVVFAAFGKEEKGLVGSRAMVRAIPEDQLPQYCAMINIDSLGLGPPQVADNMSSKAMGAFAGALAKEMEIPFAHASIGRANSDSSSFVARKIPAVTLHGLNNQWQRVLHSGNDQVAKVNPVSVYLGYRLALAMAVRLQQAACNAYR